MHKINTMKAYVYLLRTHQEFGSKLFSNLCKRKNTTSYTTQRFYQIKTDQFLRKSITSPDIRLNKPTLRIPHTQYYAIY